MLNATALKKVLPLCKEPELWANALNPAMTKFGINTPARIASFLAQTGFESGQFNNLVENLNYKTPARLMKVWPKRFPTQASTTPYVNNQEKLANFVYANRIGNGDVNSGDGFRYRGRGIIQITGKSNYAETGKALGVDLINHPELLVTPELAALSAAYFWQGHGLNALADDQTGDDDLEDFTTITKKINGGTAGLSQRLALFKAIEQTLVA
ncbi:MAG: glycoside hydrolase family 19 protein [Methylococcaceae bacterium]